MQRVVAEPLVYEFSRHLEARATIQPGETLVVESEDALSGQLKTGDDRRDKSTVPKSNPVAGPILVEGAEPGDALAVTVDLGNQPVEGQLPRFGDLFESVPERRLHGDAGLVAVDDDGMADHGRAPLHWALNAASRARRAQSLRSSALSNRSGGAS